MNTPDTVTERYLALWNDPDDASRRARLDTDWTDEPRYADPMISGEGRDGIAEMIAGARVQFPGHTFVGRGASDGHGRWIRFSWTLQAPDGAAVAAGTDVVTIDASGRIAEVVGFLDGGAS